MIPKSATSHTHGRRRLSTPIALAAALLTVFAPAPRVSACPAAIFGVELQPRPVGPRKGLRLFVKSDANGKWRPIPIQVDPVDRDGHLIFFDSGSYMQRDLMPEDYISFRTEEFGVKLEPPDKLPCQSNVVYEIRDYAPKNKYAYLLNCGFQAAHIAFPYMVDFDAKQNLLKSATYKYVFNAANYMQFDSIHFLTEKGAFDQVGKDSRLLIKADVKKFFTMNFDSDEIESHLEASRLGPVGDLARLSFFLKILLFKIKMSLSTDVAFYTDAGHIPMMVNIPVNAYEYLNPASGILYTWIPAPQGKDSNIDMPILDEKLVHQGWEQLKSKGATYCKEGVRHSCYYKYGYMLGSRKLEMDFEIEKKIVDRGFFPFFVDDVAKHKEAMGWDIEIPAGERRVGLYFEVSGLPEGGHPWEFWLRLGSSAEATGICPVPVRFSRLR